MGGPLGVHVAEATASGSYRLKSYCIIRRTERGVW
jgi:hypothetical protein